LTTAQEKIKTKVKLSTDWATNAFFWLFGSFGACALLFKTMTKH